MDMLLISAINHLQNLLLPELSHIQSKKHDLSTRIQRLTEEIQETESTLRSQRNQLGQLKSELESFLEGEKKDTSISQMDQKLKISLNHLILEVVGSLSHEPSAVPISPPVFSSIAVKASSDRCQVHLHGLLEVVSSFEQSIQSAESVEDLEESTCWTLLKEIGIKRSKIKEIEDKLSQSSTADRGLKSMMINWSQNLLVEQLIKELDGLIDSEEASRLMLSLWMISKGLKMIRIPYWMNKSGPSNHDIVRDDGLQSKNLAAIYLNSDDLENECKLMISLMDDNEIFSKRPMSKKQMAKEIITHSISSIQLLMRSEDLLSHFPISHVTKERMREFLKCQQQHILEELDEQVNQLKSPKSSHYSEDKRICLFLPRSASGDTATRIKYLSTIVGTIIPTTQQAFKEMNDLDSDPFYHSEANQIFEKIDHLIIEIKQHFPDDGNNNSSFSGVSARKHINSLSPSKPTKWAKLDQFLESIFEGKQRPEGFDCLSGCLKAPLFDLRCAGIAHLSPEIGQFVSLQTLYLQKNQLHSVPPEIGQLLRLENLWLWGNQLCSLPTEIGQLLNLQKMNLGNNQLTSIPKELGQLESLQILDMHDNQLSSLPPEIGSLEDLKILWIDSNQLQSIPAEIGQLINLQSLLLWGNRLLSIPEEIGHLIKLQSLDLGSNQLLSIPKEISQLRDLQNLGLENNQLQQIPIEISQLMNLKALHLTKNRLQSVPSEIGQLINLQSLYLSSNQLYSLPIEISLLVNLKLLDLSKNQFQSMPLRIGHLLGLKTLDFYDNQLQSLPECIGQLVNLQSLYLGANQLQCVPKDIEGLKSLLTLDLRDNIRLKSEFGCRDHPIYSRLPNLRDLIIDSQESLKLDQFFHSVFEAKARKRPEGIKTLKRFLQITELNLRSSSIKTLPGEISQLKNLQTLDLGGNQLLSLPHEISRLLNLQTLHLDANQLQSMPLEIGKLTNLQILYLHQNFLQLVPAEIGQLLHLQTLYLKDNQIQLVPSEIGNLVNLQSLYLHQNQIQSIPVEIGQLVNLQSLYLHQNRLRSLPAEIGQLENLQTLYLWGNQLQSLPVEITHLINLRSLRLENNQLRSLPSEIGRLKNLQTLSLQSNHLQSVPKEIGQLESLQSLDLRDNFSLRMDFSNRAHWIYSTLSKLDDFKA